MDALVLVGVPIVGANGLPAPANPNALSDAAPLVTITGIVILMQT